MNKPKALVAGNWKMNGLQTSLQELAILETLLEDDKDADCDVLLCPPYTLISLFAANAEKVEIGAQDCHTAVSGAHTGDVSAEMIADAGAGYVIVGHSERRIDHSETSAQISAKAKAAHDAGLKAIICTGETLVERDTGHTSVVVLRKLKKSLPETATSDNTVIGYEPLWAIGTGKTPTAKDVAEIHTEIRNYLVDRYGEDGHKFRIIYGGSVKPSNAVELMSAANVNGALVGGASLKADDFNGIIEAYRA